MKKILFATLFLSILFSCKKEEVNPIPKVGEIIFYETKYGLNRLVIADCLPQSIDTSGYKYEWRDDYGFIYNHKTLNWKPSKTGLQNIYVKITKGGVVEKKVSVTVVKCDFGYAFWGEHPAIILINEPNQPSEIYLENISQWIYFNDSYKGEKTKYYLSSNALRSGEVQFTTRHNPNNLNTVQIYYTIWLNAKLELTLKYGTPLTDQLIWFGIAETDESKFGLAIYNYKLECKATWNTTTTNIILKSKHYTNNTFDFGHYYSPL